ncbi:MAG: FTR1 family protein [Gemmatimonadota bacterium]|nr:FTR1 family protein [Gemmatimonadota bacterium]MDH5283306.1 FTR1 family protein [Gemmatimonadota bacterium]
MVLGTALWLILAFAAKPAAPAEPQDPEAAVRRIAAITSLAAQEYALGVRDGKVIAPPEVEEARLFFTEARRTAGLLPPDAGRPAMAEIDTLLQLVQAIQSPDSVSARARRLSESLAARYGISLQEAPAAAPPLALGREVYATECASCHGSLGRGDGSAAANLSPPPADLTDFRFLADATPLDFYRRITIGVAGTAMPAYESRLTGEERWAVAVYAGTLRYPEPRGEVPAELRDFAATASMSDNALAASLAPGTDFAAPDLRARLAAVRVFRSEEPAGAAATLVFESVRRQLDSAMSLAGSGQHEAASAAAFDAYMTFEQVERGIRARQTRLADALEAGFASLRTRAAGGATPAELGAIHSRLLGDLENGERAIGGRLSPLNLFIQSFVLLLREGLEAILVVGALMAFLTKTGAGHRRRDIHVGVGAAIGASLLTALLLETIFQVSRARQETLEGAVMLVAAAMLFYVSYWLLSKMEVAKWNRFVRGRVQEAVSSGSALALASVAFLAVYREGFETVLFYKALFLAGAGSTMPVLLGMGCGAVALAAVYYAVNRWGVRIPLKPFFGFTSAFLYYMAFVFIGTGIAELQEGGVIGTTVLPWAPRLPALGVYPTAESLLAQAALLALLLAGLAWTFWLEPRRLRVTNEMLPEAPRPATEPVDAPALAKDVLRSLDRMDADLAELRDEVERLKRTLTKSSAGSGKNG